MHDLFEGVVPYEMKLLLCHCVGEKFFTTFDFLNNKPSQIDSNVGRRDDFKIKQSASQMMALSREFAIIIGDKYPWATNTRNDFILNV